MSKMDDDQAPAAPTASTGEQRAAEIAEWLRYQPYVPASVRETLLREIARLRSAAP